MASFSRNCFRIEPSSNSTARASSVITFNFPEGSTLDLRSLCFYCKASGQENAVATSRFPRHAPAECRLFSESSSWSTASIFIQA
eukprot:1623586-Pleurochrysis_carterae.AAC.1